MWKVKLLESLPYLYASIILHNGVPSSSKIYSKELLQVENPALNTLKLEKLSFTSETLQLMWSLTQRLRVRLWCEELLLPKVYASLNLSHFHYGQSALNVSCCKHS